MANISAALRTLKSRVAAQNVEIQADIVDLGRALNDARTELDMLSLAKRVAAVKRALNGFLLQLKIEPRLVRKELAASFPAAKLDVALPPLRAHADDKIAALQRQAYACTEALLECNFYLGCRLESATEKTDITLISQATRGVKAILEPQ